MLRRPLACWQHSCSRSSHEEGRYHYFCTRARGRMNGSGLLPLYTLSG